MPSLTVDTGYRPHRLQALIHRTIGRFAVVVAHRRFGKTVLAIMELVHRAARDRSGTGRYGYVAPFLRQAKEVSWDYLRRYTATLPGVKVHEGELIVTLSNGSRIRLYGADNADAMRGTYFDYVVVDEVADMKPHVFGEIIRPALADRKGGALFIGTPKGINLLSELYHGDPTDGWTRLLYRADETGIIDEEELALARYAMSDAQYRQEFLCDWSASVDNALITIDMVSDAARRIYMPRDIDFAPVVLGVDVARFGADRSVVVRRQGLQAFDPIVRQGADTMEVAGLIAAQVKEHDPDAVFIDGSPASYGVIDYLTRSGHRLIEINFGGVPLDPRYADRRSEMWDLMARWLRAGGGLMPGSDLKTDLCGPTYTFTPAGKFQLERKDDIKKRGLRSPDLGDALALTFAQPVVKKTAPIHPALAARTMIGCGDYDPHAALRA